MSLELLHFPLNPEDPKPATLITIGTGETRGILDYADVPTRLFIVTLTPQNVGEVYWVIAEDANISPAAYRETGTDLKKKLLIEENRVARLCLDKIFYGSYYMDRFNNPRQMAVRNAGSDRTPDHSA